MFLLLASCDQTLNFRMLRRAQLVLGLVKHLW